MCLYLHHLSRALVICRFRASQHPQMSSEASLKEGDGSINDTFKGFPLGSFPPPPLGFVAVLDSDMSISEAAKVVLVTLNFAWISFSSKTSIRPRV